MISGRVVDAGTGQPIGGAIVTLNGVGGLTLPMRVGDAMMSSGGGPPTAHPRLVTGADGQFAFRGLAKGTFGVSASKLGVLPGAYGMLRPEGSSQTIALDEGERRADVTIRLFRYATIAGTVVDESGEPFAGVPVRATRRVLTGGHRVLGSRTVPAMTDDRGMYRLTSLTPGEYIVGIVQTQNSAPAAVTTGSAGTHVTADRRFVLTSAMGPLAATLDAGGRLLAYPTTYFPGARTAAQATPIVVGSGEERLGIDMVLSQLPTANVSGRITVTEGQLDGYQLRLTPSEGGNPTSDPEVALATTDTEGSFMFLAVPSGQYVLQTSRVIRPPVAPVTTAVSGRAGTPPAGTQFTVVQSMTLYWAATPVSLGGEDVRDLTLLVQPGLTVSGRLEFDGGAQPSARVNVAGSISPADGAIAMPGGFNMQWPLRQFTTTGLPPGRYMAAINSVPPGWVLKSVMAGGVDISETPFELIDRDVTNVVITLTDKPSAIAGVVRGPQADPDDAAAVIAFPTDPRLWQDYGSSPRRLKTARTSPKGTFTLSGLPPGDYHVIAISDEFAAEWQDPRFLQVLSRQATRVAVSEGQKVTVDLTRATVRLTDELVESTRERVNAGTRELRIVGKLSRSSYPAYLPSPASRASPASPAYEAQVRDTRVVQPPTGSGSVSGVVLSDDGTQRPIRRARVSLRTPDSRHEYAATTDQAGRFIITGVPAGRYTVMSSKLAYLPAFYGAGNGVLPPGIPVAVGAGQAVRGLTMKMSQGGVITGTVLDDFGGPILGARIHILQSIGAGSDRRLTAAASQGTPTTDDRGGFRAFGLPPGRYIVGVAPPVTGGELRAAANPSRTIGYAPVYYPGTSVPGEATPVTVAVGQEAAGIDIPMRLVPTAKIQGTVVGPDGQPAPFVQLQFVSSEQMQGPVTQVGSGSVTADGWFMTAALVPGRYSVVARAVDRQGGPPVGSRNSSVNPLLWAVQEVDLRGENVSGVALVLQPALTVSGKVVFEGTTASALADAGGLRVVVSGALPAMLVAGVPAVTIDAGGQFVVPNLVPGQYRFTASELSLLGSSPAGVWSLRSITSGGRDLLDYPLDLRPGQPVTDVVFSYSNETTELSGRLLDAAGKPVRDLSILLFTTDRGLWSSGPRRVRAPVRPAEDGTFRFVNLAPGEYFLGAVTDVDPREATDPVFLERVTPSAIRVTVAPGEKKVQDLRIAGLPPASGPAARSATRPSPAR